MASSDETSAIGGDDILDSPCTSDTSLHIYTFSPSSKTVRLRRQVKIACTKCQKACKKCDLGRPCLRCTRYRFGPEECVDSQRKERKKGVKRGPYKKRDSQGWRLAIWVAGDDILTRSLSWNFRQYHWAEQRLFSRNEAGNIGAAERSTALSHIRRSDTSTIRP
ncbi:hypothetical protein B0H12DRAFT_813991 [Mycena haematopus]|nr:hypothetical protein B0H12DRAFT_813991 [Mycena haematopus]